MYVARWGSFLLCALCAVSTALKPKRHVTITALSPQQSSLIRQFAENEIISFNHDPVFTAEFKALTSAGLFDAYVQAVHSIQTNQPTTQNFISFLNNPPSTIHQAPQHTAFPSTLEAKILSILKADQSREVSFARSLVATNHAAPSTTSKAAAPPPSPSAQPSHGSNTGAIVGGVIGGLAGLILIAGVLYFILRRRRRQPQFDMVSPRHQREMTEEHDYGTGTGHSSATAYDTRTPAEAREFEKRMPEQNEENFESSVLHQGASERDEESSEPSAFENRIPAQNPEGYSESGEPYRTRRMDEHPSISDMDASRTIVPEDEDNYNYRDSRLSEKTPDLPYHVGPYFPPDPKKPRKTRDA